MKTIQIPYYRSSMELHISEENLKAVVTARMHEFKPEKGERELVEEALAHPIGTRTLRELAEGKKKVTLVTSDHTRAVPSKLTLPILLREIRAGSPDAEITILIGTGLHRPTTPEEQRQMFGDEIVDHERIVANNAFDPDQFVKVCELPSGADFCVNKLAVECDLLVTEGFIEPHFFAGFSGGRKSILPGICSKETVNENHCYKAIASPYAATGVLEGNPIHEDMVCAARKVNVQFILNVALDGEKKVIAAFAGDLEAAHEKGVAFIRSQSQCPAVTGDIVVTSNGGYPLDQNIYQSVKGMTAAEATVKEGGVIIMVSKCADGHGGKFFHETFRDEKDLNRMMETFLSRKPEETIIDQWQSQIFARLLLKATVIFVSSCEDQLVEDLHMVPAHSMEEALEKAKTLVGKEDYTVTVIPDGVSVIVKE